MGGEYILKIKKVIPYFLLLVLIILNITGCSRNNFPKKEDKYTKTQKIAISALSDTFSMCKIKKFDLLKYKNYNNWHLFLFYMTTDNSPQYLLCMVENNKALWYASAGYPAMSMGFGVNRVKYKGKSIYFCNLNTSTWIPSTGARKPTNYTKMVFEFEDGKKFIEDVKGDKGYIVIVDGYKKLKDLILYNAKGEIVNRYEDIGYDCYECKVVGFKSK